MHRETKETQWERPPPSPHALPACPATSTTARTSPSLSLAAHAVVAAPFKDDGADRATLPEQTHARTKQHKPSIPDAQISRGTACGYKQPQPRREQHQSQSHHLPERDTSYHSDSSAGSRSRSCGRGGFAHRGAAKLGGGGSHGGGFAGFKGSGFRPRNGNGSETGGSSAQGGGGRAQMIAHAPGSSYQSSSSCGGGTKARRKAAGLYGWGGQGRSTTSGYGAYGRSCQSAAVGKQVQHITLAGGPPPDADAAAPTPAMMKSTLLAHQGPALAWLKWREGKGQVVRGGIFADDMGLGKTITVLALISSKWREGKTAKPTLIVCPASLLQHWEKEIKAHLCKCNIIVLHGKTKALPDDIDEGSSAVPGTIVLTTYETLAKAHEKSMPKSNVNSKPKSTSSSSSSSSSSSRKGQISQGKQPASAGGEPSGAATAAIAASAYGREWDRIVLDEGHVIRNSKTKVSAACCAIAATKRWIVTGTPMNNSLTELHAIVGMFLQCGMFADRAVWKKQVDNGTDLGRHKLLALLGSLMLRRTKSDKLPDGSMLVPLPGRAFKQHLYILDATEQRQYDAIIKHFKSSVTRQARRGVKGKGKTGSDSTLLRIMQLRQMCCHPKLATRPPGFEEEGEDTAGAAPKESGGPNTRTGAVLSSEGGSCADVTTDDGLSGILSQLTFEERSDNVFSTKTVGAISAGLNCDTAAPAVAMVDDADDLIASMSKMTVVAPPSLASARSPAPAPASVVKLEEEGASATSPGEGHDGEAAALASPVPSTEQHLCDSSSSGSNDVVGVGSDADQTMSSKMKLFFIVLKEALATSPNGRPSKAVVISQWTGFLDMIQAQCVLQGRAIVRLDGKVRVDQRQQLVDEFNDGEAQIMLLSLQAGGVGLNLVGANHCFVLDLPYNPSMLDQACDRVYRVGQEREVTVHTFVCKKSVEQWQLKMLERKRELASMFLEQKVADRLSADDIKEPVKMHAGPPTCTWLSRRRRFAPQPDTQPIGGLLRWCSAWCLLRRALR